MYSEIINQLKDIQQTLNSDSDDNWMSVNNVCQYTGLSPSTIHRATQKGSLKVSKATGKNLFKKAWVDSFLGE